MEIKNALDEKKMFTRKGARVRKFTFTAAKERKKLILDYCVLGNLLKSAQSARKAISSGELRVLRDFAKT